METDRDTKNPSALAAIKRIEEFRDEPRHGRNLEDKAFFCKAIFEYAQSVCTSHGLNAVTYGGGTGVIVNFSVPESLNSFLEKVESAKRADWFRRNKSLLGDDWPSFDAYFQSRPFPVREKIRKHFEVAAWKSCKGLFFEWAVLLSLLCEFGLSFEVSTKTLCIGSAQPPILLRINDTDRYLWYQKTIVANLSGMKARPDILLTTDQNTPSKQNITGVIGCKNIKRLTTRLLREEYGKSKDVGPDYTIVCSYEEIERDIRDGASNLGIMVFVNPLSTQRRALTMKEKVVLLEEVRSQLLRAESEKPLRTRELIERQILDRKRRIADTGSS